MSETTKTPRGNAVYRRFYNPREGRADANAMAEHIGSLETALAAAERLLALFGVAKCEACGGNGRSVEFGADFETPEQVQCQDCAGVGHIQKQTAAERELAGVPAPQSEAHVKTPPRAMLGYSQFSHLAGVETATRGTPVSSPPPGPTSANAESGGAVEVWGVYSRRGILFAASVTADEAQRYPAAYDASRPAGAPHYVVHLVPASRLDAAERERDGALDLVKIRTDSRNRWKGCAYEQFGVVDQLRADLARVTEQRNEAQDQYLAEQARADALQRRIEGGIKCWRFGDGSTVLHKPSAKGVNDGRK